MIYEIANEFLKVKADTNGAILNSLCDNSGTEYIWQGDAAYWNEQGANLFPYIARLWEQTYSFQGKNYHMDIHGFAKNTQFCCEKINAQELLFTMEDSEETRKQYPFCFRFEVCYRLEGKKLHVSYKVRNNDSKTMYFGVGGHPGINLPLENGLGFEDYRLEFSEECKPWQILFSKECFVDGKSLYELDGNGIRLFHGMFDEDAIVLEQTSGTVSLFSEKGHKGVKMVYEDMPYIGFWHMPHTDAPYICIEPWSSLPARHGIIEDFEKQENLISLAPRETCVRSWSLELLEE